MSTQVIFRPLSYSGKFLSPSVLFFGVVSCSGFRSYLEGSHFAICHDRWLFVKINNCPLPYTCFETDPRWTGQIKLLHNLWRPPKANDNLTWRSCRPFLTFLSEIIQNYTRDTLPYYIQKNHRDFFVLQRFKE